MKKAGKQMDCFQDDDKLGTPIDNAVYNIKQDSLVRDKDVVDSSVYNVKQDTPIQSNADNVFVDDFRQVHFGVTITLKEQSKRTTIMLEGYLVKALQSKHGLTDNSSIRGWLEQMIKNDSRFDSVQPLTKQLKRLVIESFV